MFFFLMRRPPPRSTLFPSRTLFRPAAYLVGFATTSNLEAGRRYGVPTSGTSAHAFTLLHDDERSAFQAQGDTLGRSEEHTSELQSRQYLVCRLLLEETLTRLLGARA